MKKLMIVLMAALVLMGTLLVSCNQNVGEDKLSSVTISEDLAKGLTTSLDPNVKPVGQLAWYYKATKDDNGFFVTGQKTEWTLLPTSAQGLVGQSLGQMSYGAWKFEFEGRDYDKPTATAAYTVEYYCDGLYETINKEETALTVPLKQGAAFDKAGIIFENLIFTLNGVEVNDSVKIPSTETGSTIGQVQLVITETGTDNSWAFTGTSYVPATTDPAKPACIAFTPASSNYFSYDTYSSHTYGFVVKYNDVAIMTPFAYTVYIELGYDMTISGDINAYEQKSDVTIEKTSESWTVQTAYTEDTAVNPMVATTDATPAKLADATSTGKTTVNASVAALAVANGEIASGSKVANSVKVTVSSIETASVAFTATADNNAFAGIDLKLIKKVTTGTESVTSEVENANFGTNNPVTVETYIAKGLTNVVLTYPADTQATQPTLVDYDPLTGRLVFTTTHFSEFAVFADQYIFDKTTNMAYKLDENGLLDDATFDDTHEYILLDPTKANLVSDDIDVFNASKSNWTVLHDSSDVENTTDFAGGYGTKIEPYLVYDKNTMQKISNFYNGDYCYYKVAIEKTNEGIIDCSQWTPVNMYGCFDGCGVRFINLDECLFQNVKAKNNTAVVVKNFDCTFDVLTDNDGAVIGCVRHADTVCNIYLSKIYVHGRFISTYAASAYIGWGNGGNGNYVYNFTDCVADITLGATNNTVSGFVYHPYAASDEYHIYNSAFIGSALVADTWGPYEFNAQGGGTTTATYTQEFLEAYPLSSVFSNAPSTAGTYTYNRYSSTLTGTKGAITTNKIDGTLPAVGDAFETTKVDGATKALVTYNFGPNPGNLYSTFLSEEIPLSSVETGASFATSLVKYYKIAINGTEIVSGENHGNLPSGVVQDLNLYNLNWAGSDGTVHTADVKIVQFDPNTSVLTIWTVAIPHVHEQ